MQVLCRLNSTSACNPAFIDLGREKIEVQWRKYPGTLAVSSSELSTLAVG